MDHDASLSDLTNAGNDVASSTYASTKAGIVNSVLTGGSSGTNDAIQQLVN